MTTTPKPSPMLKAAPLWAKTSVKGGQYLTGRLGGVKVLVLENRDRSPARLAPTAGDENVSGLCTRARTDA
jgi:hypothetical protein